MTDTETGSNETGRATVDVEIRHEAEREGTSLLRHVGNDSLAIRHSILGDVAVHAFGPKARREFRELAEYFAARDALRADPTNARIVNTLDLLKDILRADAVGMVSVSRMRGTTAEDAEHMFYDAVASNPSRAAAIIRRLLA